MEISLLNVKITIQKNTTIVDGIGNHTNEWGDFYICHAKVSREGDAETSETSVAGVIIDDSDIDFTVRFCKKVLEVTNTGYRIQFNGEIFNIQSVDHMNYKKKSIKFKCKKERR